MGGVELSGCTVDVVFDDKQLPVTNNSKGEVYCTFLKRKITVLRNDQGEFICTEVATCDKNSGHELYATLLA